MAQGDIKKDLLESPVQIPAWWKSKEQDIQQFIDKTVKKGEVRLLSTSPGGRPVKGVFYGEAEPELKGKANFNSAVAARYKGHYYRREERKWPVLIALAGVHGQEIESMVGACSLISLMETGRDIQGKEQPELLDKLQQLRLIIIPMANPDGRARVPYEGWVGLPKSEMSKWGQGTDSNGKPYQWPYCKSTHPMVGNVGILGGYFDDAGVNMQHDEWSSPMSPTTRAILDLVREEGPDMVLNMHSHEYDPSILPVAYIPYSARKSQHAFYKRFYSTISNYGYVGREFDILGSVNPEFEDEPAFGMNCMLYHVGAKLCFTYESPHGCSDTRKPDHTIYEKNPYGYEDIIKLQHLLYDCAADFCIKRL